METQKQNSKQHNLEAAEQKRAKKYPKIFIEFEGKVFNGVPALVRAYPIINKSGFHSAIEKTSDGRDKFAMVYKGFLFGIDIKWPKSGSFQIDKLEMLLKRLKKNQNG